MTSDDQDLHRFSAAAAVVTVLRDHMLQRSDASLDTLYQAVDVSAPAGDDPIALLPLAAATSELVAAGRVSWTRPYGLEILRHASDFVMTLYEVSAAGTPAHPVELARIITTMSASLLLSTSVQRSLQYLIPVLFDASLESQDPLPLHYLRRSTAFGMIDDPMARALVLLSPPYLGDNDWTLDEAKAALRAGISALTATQDVERSRYRDMVRVGVTAAQAFIASGSFARATNVLDMAEKVSTDPKGQAASVPEPRSTAAELKGLSDLYEALFEDGDYSGAFLAADRLLKRAPSERVRLLAKNRAALAQMQRGIYDNTTDAGHLILNVASLVSLPGVSELSDREPLLAPEGMIDELVVHHSRSQDAALQALVLIGIEALADTQVLAAAPPSGLAIQRLYDVQSRADLESRNPDFRVNSLGVQNYLASQYRFQKPLNVLSIRAVEWNRRISLCVSAFYVSGRGGGSRQIPLYGTDARLVRRLTDRPWTVERLTERELIRLREVFIPGGLRDLPHIVIAPGASLWTLPFELLLPKTAVSVTPSLGAWIRMPLSTEVAYPLRVLTVSDETLAGVSAELRVLKELEAMGSVVLEAVRSFADLKVALTSRSWDVLVIATHGQGSGLSYEFLIDDEKLPAAAVASQPLPAIVVVAACNSGQLPVSASQITLTSTLLSSGTAAVLLALWEIDDRRTGEVLGQFYRHLVARRSAPAAWEDLQRSEVSPARVGLRLLTRVIEPDSYGEEVDYDAWMRKVSTQSD